MIPTLELKDSEKSFEDLYHLECKFAFKTSKERIEKVKFSLLKSILDWKNLKQKKQLQGILSQ